MRRPISWSALTSASVGLWGLGVEGLASLQRLQSMGIEPVLVDDKVASDALHGLPVLRMDDGGLTALLSCDVVIKSPGISRYRPEVDVLERAGVPVCGGLGLWLEDTDRQRVVCITGTKGKSTTSMLVCHLLSGLGYRARVGGNIGQPPWALSDEAAPDYWIIETSSFQVPDLTVAPPVVVVTSLSPDHLDWHGSVERYYADKLSLCTKPGVETALVPADDQLLRQQLGDVPTVQWVDRDQFGRSWIDHLGLPGSHNARNASLARAALVALGIDEAGDEAALARAAEGFSGLESRCHSIGHVGGVDFVDDGLSTNVLSVAAALEAYESRPVALLVGGSDRGIDYSMLGEAVRGRQERTLVVTMPDNGPRIGQAVRDVTDNVEVIDAPDLEAAVTAAFRWCDGDGVVLLSPGAPSFGHFADYRDRGRAFVDAAATCGTLVDEIS